MVAQPRAADLGSRLLAAIPLCGLSWEGLLAWAKRERVGLPALELELWWLQRTRKVCVCSESRTLFTIGRVPRGDL